VEAGVDKCRHGGGPAFIEAVTYRFEGHYGGDPQWTYRSREEVARWRAKCPLVRLRSRLIDSGVSEDRLRAIDEQVSQDLYSDEAWALEQPFPTVEQATSHVMIPLNQD
jgi:pyruvate dehydrogenase E1 component alpha subunit